MPRRARAVEDAFRFGHILVRDAAYAGLAKRTRAELHERFADWLEGRGRRLASTRRSSATTSNRPPPTATSSAIPRRRARRRAGFRHGCATAGPRALAIRRPSRGSQPPRPSRRHPARRRPAATRDRLLESIPALAETGRLDQAARARRDPGRPAGLAPRRRTRLARLPRRPAGTRRRERCESWPGVAVGVRGSRRSRPDRPRRWAFSPRCNSGLGRRSRG